MSINIGKVQKQALSSDWDFGGDNITEFAAVGSLFEKYGEELLKNISKYANQKHVVASGALLDSMVPEIEEGPGYTTFRLLLIDYYDYPNEGVKGVKSSKNAPSSPYKYRNLGVSKKFEESLIKYIQSGKAKISSVRNDKALGIGGEKKGLRLSQSKKTLVQREAATLGYLIKRFGIKTTNYFTDAFNKTFENFQVEALKAVEEGIIITFTTIKEKK